MELLCCVLAAATHVEMVASAVFINILYSVHVPKGGQEQGVKFPSITVNQILAIILHLEQPVHLQLLVTLVSVLQVSLVHAVKLTPTTVQVFLVKMEECAMTK